MSAARGWLWGPLSPLGLGIAAVTLILDQAHKAWMLYVYDIGAKGTVRVAPFLDLVLVWNQGVSYGMLQQRTELGRCILILFAFAAAIALALWLARINSRLTAVCIGLIIGGAIGNAIDRILYGAVADFFSFHAFGYEWYIFNIADTAIVAGSWDFCMNRYSGDTKRSQTLLRCEGKPGLTGVSGESWGASQPPS